MTITGIGNYSGEFDRTYQITKAPLTITSESATKVYDGKELTRPEVTIEGLVGGETLEAEAIGSITNVGSVKNEIVIHWGEESAKAPLMMNALRTVPGVRVKMARDDRQDGEGENVAKMSNYEVAVNEGALEVTKASITVKTGSAEKEYDGKPLTCDEASISGLAEGEEVTITATGSQTEVGSSENTYSIDWGDVDEANYEITEEDLGTLTVTEATVEPEPTPEPPAPTPEPAPKTGDPTSMTLPILVMAASLILLAILILVARRRRQN